MKKINNKIGRCGRKPMFPADFEESYRKAESLDELRIKYNVHMTTIDKWQRTLSEKRVWKRGRPEKYSNDIIQSICSMNSNNIPTSKIAEKMQMNVRTVLYLINKQKKGT